MNQAVAFDLFGHGIYSLPSVGSEGVKYAGSKLKLLPHILDLIESVKVDSVLDGFSGSTRVSQALAWADYRVVASDISTWSTIFGQCYLKGRNPTEYIDIIRHLNAVKPQDGWFTEHYGGRAYHHNGEKYPWQIHNTRKLDGIRNEIENLNLDPIDESVVLTSLILALDKVDSTLGHFASYLKEWSPRSYKKLVLEVPKIVTSTKEHEVIKGDIFDTIKNRQFDLAYFDPPYGSNNEKMPPSRVRYASYYHIWTTVCLNDEPKIFGAAKRREDTRDTVASSVFEEFRKDDDGEYIAVKSIKRLLSEVNARYIVLSYSSGGRATADELNKAIKDIGRLVQVKQIDYKKNVMARMRWTDEWVQDSEKQNLEFLFLVEKN